MVGTSIKGNLGPLALETPHASSIFSFEPRISEVSLATSIDDPPPKPITPVILFFFPISIAFISVFSEGSASTSWKTSTFEDNLFNSIKVGSVNFNDIKSLSVINKIFCPSF